MKKKTKLSIIVIGLISIACLAGVIYYLFLVVLFLIPTNERDNKDPTKQKEMMAIVLEWGRLAPFPANATNISVKTEGSMFTRSFRASFVAPKQDIQEWIENSPGLNEATPEELTENKVWYRIKPGGGANMAEVTIDYNLNKVEIWVSWS